MYYIIQQIKYQRSSDIYLKITKNKLNPKEGYFI